MKGLSSPSRFFVANLAKGNGIEVNAVHQDELGLRIWKRRGCDYFVNADRLYRVRRTKESNDLTRNL